MTTKKYLAKFSDGEEKKRTSKAGRNYKFAWRLKFPTGRAIFGFSGDTFNAHREAQYRAKQYTDVAVEVVQVLEI